MRSLRVRPAAGSLPVSEHELRQTRADSEAVPPHAQRWNRSPKAPPPSTFAPRRAGAMELIFSFVGGVGGPADSSFVKYASRPTDQPPRQAPERVKASERVVIVVFHLARTRIDTAAAAATRNKSQRAQICVGVIEPMNPLLAHTKLSSASTSNGVQISDKARGNRGERTRCYLAVAVADAAAMRDGAGGGGTSKIILLAQTNQKRAGGA